MSYKHGSANASLPRYDFFLNLILCGAFIKWCT